MSRLFYTLEEAAEKLKKSPAELLQMARTGQLQEFRTGEEIKFKAADIDQLAAGDDDGLDLELGDLGGSSSGGFDLPLSGSGAGGPAIGGDGLDLDLDLGAPSVPASHGAQAQSDDDLLGGLGIGDSGASPVPLGLADSNPGQGRSGGHAAPAVEDDLLGLADSSPGQGRSGGHAPVGLADSNPGQARSGSHASAGLADSGPVPSGGVSGDGGLSDSGLNLDTVGSGSGLLDMTRDAADESSMGLQLFEEVSADESAPGAESGLFADVAAGGDGDSAEPAAAIGAFGVGQAVIPEYVSGAWSGATTGLMLGAAASLVICLIIAIGTSLGGAPTLTAMIKGDMMTWVGGLAGAVVVFGVAGFFIGRATE